MKFIVHVSAAGGFTLSFDANDFSEAAEKIGAEIEKRYGHLWSSISTKIEMDKECGGENSAEG